MARSRNRKQKQKTHHLMNEWVNEWTNEMNIIGLRIFVYWMCEIFACIRKIFNLVTRLLRYKMYPNIELKAIYSFICGCIESFYLLANVGVLHTILNETVDRRNVAKRIRFILFFFSPLRIILFLFYNFNWNWTEKFEHN